MMKDWKYLKFQYFIPVIYYLLVILCMSLTSNPKGNFNLGWAEILTILTLPWSILIVFLWIVLHGDTLSVFPIMYLLFALINAILIYFGFRRKKFEIDIKQ